MFIKNYVNVYKDFFSKSTFSAIINTSIDMIVLINF